MLVDFKKLIDAQKRRKEMREVLIKHFPHNTKHLLQNVKIGRNDKCLCGSGKKYKKCCLKKELVQC